MEEVGSVVELAAIEAAIGGGGGTLWRKPRYHTGSSLIYVFTQSLNFFLPDELYILSCINWISPRMIRSL